MYTFLSVLAEYILVTVLGFPLLLWLVFWSDRRWYRRHPGAEERFAQIDEELTRQGR